MLEDGRNEACSTHNRNERGVQMLVCKTEEGRLLGTSRRIWRDDIKMDLEVINVQVRFEFIWMSPGARRGTIMSAVTSRPIKCGVVLGNVPFGCLVTTRDEIWIVAFVDYFVLLTV